MRIRPTTPADRQGLLALYPKMFPGEDLVPLVEALLDHAGDEAILSLAPHRDGAPVGHIVMTLCTVGEGGPRVGLLGPLGVHPDLQRQGLGGALIAAGVEAMRTAGAAAVLVLGDPAYYGRFGFAAGHAVKTPYPIPQDWSQAWRLLPLTADAGGLSGTLAVPSPWRDARWWDG